SPGCSREGHEERISLRVDLDAPVGCERITQDASMLREHPRVPLGAEIVQQRRRTFDVREEEGDGPGRQAVHRPRGSRFLPPNASGKECGSTEQRDAASGYPTAISFVSSAEKFESCPVRSIPREPKMARPNPQNHLKGSRPSLSIRGSGERCPQFPPRPD